MLSTILSLIVMKCFRRVIEAHIKDSFNFPVDSHLQGYRKKRFYRLFLAQTQVQKVSTWASSSTIWSWTTSGHQPPQHLFLLHHPQHWLLPELCIKSHLPGHPADIWRQSKTLKLSYSLCRWCNTLHNTFLCIYFTYWLFQFTLTSAAHHHWWLT